MGSVVPFIIWLFCLGISAIIIGKFIENDFTLPLDPFSKSATLDASSTPKKEGFTSSQGGITVTTCPSNTERYITSQGDTFCCDGDVIDGQCNGNNVCTLSPKTGSGVDSCSSWLNKEWQERSARFCTKDMPNYFGRMNRGPGVLEGCSVSRPTDDGSQPYVATDRKCIIYYTKEQELAKQDSCYNIRAMDNLVCPQANATKTSVLHPVPGKSLPAILKCNYMPTSGRSNGMPVDCMDTTSYIEYLKANGQMGQDAAADAIMNNWLNTCVSFCGASKAYYVDSTLNAPQAQCVNTMGGNGTGGLPCKFDDTTYLNLNPDVKNAGVDAKTHYKQYGINEGRQVCATGGT